MQVEIFSETSIVYTSSYNKRQ